MAEATGESESRDRNIWQGNPSQVVNLGKNIGAAILLALFIAGGGFIASKMDSLIPLWVGLGASALVLLWVFWHWLETRCYKYELTPERLRVRHGVLSRQTEELELYRVHDLELHEPFWLRLFGLGHVVLYTSDQTAPQLRIESIRQASEVRDKIRDRVEQTRQDKNVRTIEGMEMNE
jgi:membrane protein YdbS with pleckstrin-like domain